MSEDVKPVTLKTGREFIIRKDGIRLFTFIGWIEDKNIPMVEDVKPDIIVPDYFGPRENYQKGFTEHRRAHETATDLMNGRVTNDGARRVLREALDHADKIAPKPAPRIGGR